MAKLDDIKRALHILIDEATNIGQLRSAFKPGIVNQIKPLILAEKVKFDQFELEQRDRATELQTVHDELDIDFGG